MKKSELAEWRSTFSPFGIDDPTITPQDVARRLGRAEAERDDLLLKLARLSGQQPEGGHRILFAVAARQRRLDARDGYGVWREANCQCGETMLYNNGDERDLTCGDVESVKCWHCGAITVFDEERQERCRREWLETNAEKTYPRPVDANER